MKGYHPIGVPVSAHLASDTKKTMMSCDGTETGNVDRQSSTDKDLAKYRAVNHGFSERLPRIVWRDRMVTVWTNIEWST